MALTACSFESETKTTRAQAPPPGTGSIQAAPAAPTAMDTFRALAPPEGLKFMPLFSEPVADTDARIRRVEDAVQSLRNDFDTVVPSMVRLVAVEKDMKELVRQLQTLTDGPVTDTPDVVSQVEQAEPLPEQTQTAPGPAQNQISKIPSEGVAGGTETARMERAGTKASSSLVTPEAASEGAMPPEGAASPNSTAPADLALPPVSGPAVAPAVEKPPAAVNPASLGSAKAVRVGDHPDKTRVVLDMTAQVPYTAAIGPGGKTLVIDAPRMDWRAIRPFEADSAALVSGWRVEGSALVIDLLYSSTIRTHMVIAPNGTPNHRLIVDLHAGEVHGR